MDDYFDDMINDFEQFISINLTEDVRLFLRNLLDRSYIDGYNDGRFDILDLTDTNEEYDEED